MIDVRAEPYLVELVKSRDPITDYGWKPGGGRVEESFRVPVPAQLHAVRDIGPPLQSSTSSNFHTCTLGAQRTIQVCTGWTITIQRTGSERAGCASDMAGRIAHTKSRYRN